MLKVGFSPVGALSAGRYGLAKGTSYPLQGIMHVPPASSNADERRPASAKITPTVPPETSASPRMEAGEGSQVTLPLEEITKHLMGVYVDRIGYEYMHCPVKDERL